MVFNAFIEQGLRYSQGIKMRKLIDIKGNVEPERLLAVAHGKDLKNTFNTF